MNFQRWLADHAAEVVPALLPKGWPSECSGEWHWGHLIVYTQGPNAGWCKNLGLNGKLGNPISMLAWATKESWPESFERVAHFVQAIKARDSAPRMINASKPITRSAAPPMLLSRHPEVVAEKGADGASINLVAGDTERAYTNAGETPSNP